ncbi:MAG TPA: VacJ family lipoprotein [Geopsychrobacteraceae bacterium]|nr:VacJ family lipoprotein [Geopsychrobacteraceae bacterium]
MRSLLTITLLASLFISWSLPVVAAEVMVEKSSVETDDFDAAFDDDFNDFDDPPGGKARPLISDPLEGWNRGVFWVNDKFYFYLVKPVARGYRVVPRPVRRSIDNFFSNLATPVRAVNALLQFKIKDTGTELGRLLVNTTVGLAGLFDPAKSQLGWEKKQEDFGQTLGYYGVGSGWYLVLPIFGPSSARDGLGIIGDYFVIDPLNYVDLKRWEYFGIKSFDYVNSLSLDPDSYEGIKRDSLDPYLFIRAAYAQHRLAKINK